jgi:hypothetical protein
MKDLMRCALTWLADTRFARGILDRLCCSRAKQRLTELNKQSTFRAQNRTLQGLIHNARSTRFGKDHDFARIHSARDFKRLVPLRTPAELWREYWQPAFPALAGATWPGPIPYLTVCADASGGPFPYLPVTRELLVSQQAAVMTALAFILHARPRSRLCYGRLVWLGEGNRISALTPSNRKNLEVAGLHALPSFLKPIGLAPLPQTSEDAAGDANQELAELAQRCSQLSVTCLAGTPVRLRNFLRLVRDRRGMDSIKKIWPGLTAVLMAPDKESDYRDQLASELEDVLVMEIDNSPEGTLAVEDPGQHRLRLLPDQGIYFEFVPVEELGRPRPERLSSHEIRPGRPYALSISSPAGIWACLVGSVVRFERLDPPLFSLVDVGKLWERVPYLPARPMALPATVHSLPMQPPHLRTASGQPRPPAKIAAIVGHTPGIMNGNLP